MPGLIADHVCKRLAPTWAFSNLQIHRDTGLNKKGAIIRVAPLTHLQGLLGENDVDKTLPQAIYISRIIV